MKRHLWSNVRVKNGVLHIRGGDQTVDIPLERVRTVESTLRLVKVSVDDSTYEIDVSNLDLGELTLLNNLLEMAQRCNSRNEPIDASFTHLQSGLCLKDSVISGCACLGLLLTFAVVGHSLSSNNPFTRLLPLFAPWFLMGVAAKTIKRASFPSYLAGTVLCMVLVLWLSAAGNTAAQGAWKSLFFGLTLIYVAAGFVTFWIGAVAGDLAFRVWVHSRR